MKIKIILSLVFIVSLATISQAQQSMNANLIGHWNRESLPMVDDQRFNDIWGWVDSNGREYVIMGGLDSIYFIDIHDPKNPRICDVEAGRYNLAIHRDFKTYKNYCYAVADEGNSSLQIFDMRYLPDSVHKVYDNDLYSHKTHNIFVENGHLYMASNTDQKGFRPMRILSLKDPESPTFLIDLEVKEVAGKPLYSEVHDVFVRRDTAYCSCGDQGMFFFYYSDTLKTVQPDGSVVKTLQPTLKSVGNGYLTNYPSKGYNHSSWISGDGRTMVFADETKGTELKVYDVTAKNKIKLLSTFGSNVSKGSMPHNPFIRNKICYISYYEEGLQVYSLANPREPTRIAYYDTYPENGDEFRGFYGCWGVYPFFPSGVIVASDQRNGLFLVDVTVGINGLPEPKADFTIYPNPVVNDIITVKLGSLAELLKGSPIGWRITDMSGREIAAGKGSMVGDSFVISELENLQSQQLYLLTLTGNKSKNSVVFLKY